MRSHLAPGLSNPFMGNNEKLWSKIFQRTPPTHSRRCVDYIFSNFNNSFEAKEFFNYINTSHPNIKFAMEPEVEKIIPFLDFLIDNSLNFLKSSINHKSSYSGLLLNFTRFISRFYKIGLINSLIDRAYKIKKTWPDFPDVSKIQDFLKRNSYAPFF